METENIYEQNPEFLKIWECLTEREKLFAKGYVQTQNPMESARRAGYSEKSLRGIAYDILKKEKVKEAIYYLQYGQIKKFMLSTKEDATEFLIDMVHTTFNEKKYTNCLNALEILANWQGWNQAKQIDINKKEIRVSFTDNPSKKLQVQNARFKNDNSHSIKILNSEESGNPELDS